MGSKWRNKTKKGRGGNKPNTPPPTSKTTTPSSSTAAATTKPNKPSWTTLPWRKVDLNTNPTEPNDNNNIDDEDPSYSSNHYDDPNADFSELYEPNAQIKTGKNRRNQKKRKDAFDEDALVEGANDPGIIVGLEVIDGSQYRVERVPVQGGGDGEDGVGYVNRLVQSSIDENPTKTKEKEEKEEKKVENEEEDTNRKKKRKRKNQKDKNTDTSESPPTAAPEPTPDEITALQTAWSQSSSGATLHPVLCASLHRLGFSSPTPIQAATLAASIMGRRDIVGAAPTGSGKTLSYLLPILQHLFYSQDDHNDKNNKNKNQSTTTTTVYPLTALILCPTRELALQVSREFVNLLPPQPSPSQPSQAATPTSTARLYDGIKCGCIVGGFSEQKQKRVLDKKRPPVIVGTPGRLWELMERQEHEHLNNLSKLRFLVVDEADRMISQGNFPQLTKIFDEIQKVDERILESMNAEALNGGDGGLEMEDDQELGEGNKLMGLQGVAKVTMLDDILKARGNNPTRDDDNDEEDGDGENDAMDDNADDENDNVEEGSIDSANHPQEDDDDDEEENDEPMVHRQTFVYSATLTIPSTSKSTEKKGKKSSSKKNKEMPTVDGAIAEILERAGAIGETKIVDLSTSSSSSPSNKNSTAANKSSIHLPPGLSLYQIECTQRHKDSHLYLYLTTTPQGTSGPSLIFCNSIGAVRRVGETLRILGLPVRTLHANMPQKARLTALESLRPSTTKTASRRRNILVATDVAARGLDLPSVSTVVHYDVPRSMETFLHRAGRTARGVGPDAVGTSVSLVSAPEASDHAKICSIVLGGVGEGIIGDKKRMNAPQRRSFDGVAGMDGRMMTAARSRVNLASKIYSWEDTAFKREREDRWFVEAAKDADVDLEEGTLLEDGGDGDNRRRMEQIEYKRAKVELKALLSKPMRTQEFGKFLSGAGMEKARSMEEEVSPYVVLESGRSSGKGKKKNKRRRTR